MSRHHLKSRYDAFLELFQMVGKPPCEQLGGCWQIDRCANELMGCDAYRRYLYRRGSYVQYRAQNMRPLSMVEGPEKTRPKEGSKKIGD